MSSFQWPEPAWLADLPAEEREAACLRFTLGLASLYASPEMQDQELSRKLGHHEAFIGGLKFRGKITAEVAVKIERLLGRELFPRSLFRPDLFDLSAE